MLYPTEPRFPYLSALAQFRSISIFTTYIIVIILLFVWCICIIIAQHGATDTVHSISRSWRKIATFTTLALLSFVATWYFMISFLIRSYHDWASVHLNPGADLLSRLIAWLDETYLFQQAWAAIIETEPRFWWTTQIFGFASIWSVFLGVEGLCFSSTNYRGNDLSTHS